MITRITKKIFKQTRRSKLNTPLGLIKRFSSTEEQEKVVSFKKRYTLKKMTEEDIAAYHKDIFRLMQFPQSSGQDQVYEVYNKDKRDVSELISLAFIYSIPLPLLLATLSIAYLLFSGDDEEKKFENEHYNNTLKIAKLTDMVNFTGSSNAARVRACLAFLEEMNKQYGYPDFEGESMYMDQEIKRELFRLMMKDLPEKLTKDQKIDILMGYDDAMLTKFYYQNLAHNLTRVALLLTAFMGYSLFNLRKKRVKKINLNFGTRQVELGYNHMLSRGRATVIDFDSLKVEGLGASEININQDYSCEFDTGENRRNRHLTEYMLLLGDQSHIAQI